MVEKINNIETPDVDSQMTVDEFMKNIDLDSFFEVSISFEYSVNAVNFVDNLTLNLNIAKV